MIVTVETVRRMRDDIEKLKTWNEELKIELQEAIEQRDLWKDRCESVQRDMEATMLRSKMDPAGWEWH